MLEQLKELAKDYTPVEIKLDSKLRGELGLSSFDLVSLISDVEDRFGISIADEDVPNIITVEDLIKYIELKNR